MNERSKYLTICKLSFLSINTCGLKSKLRFPEFKNLINSYDIVGVQESKFDDLDSVQIHGYETIFKNRKKISRYRSGGIALIVKSSIFPFITIYETSSNLVQWFSISRSLTNIDSDIICGNIYVPPYGSKYVHQDPYLEIQTEMNTFNTNSKNIILFGNLNSRSASLQYHMVVDEFI